MKKSVVVLMLALGLAFINTRAANAHEMSSVKELVTKKKVSPFCIAIAKGDLETVKKFIELGEDVNQKSNGMYPVHYAARYNRVNVMKALMDAGAKPNRKCDNGFSVTKHAELSNATEMLSYLEQYNKA